MAFLSRDHIKEMILNSKMVDGYGDVDGQLTANGFDLRAGAIIEIVKAGKLAVEKKNNQAPELGRAWVLKGFEGRLAGYDVKEVNIVEPGHAVQLSANQAYFALSMEKLNTPNNIMTKFLPRSSLFRYTQSWIEVGFGEAGYCGFLAFLLYSPIGGGSIELGSRFAQVAFAQLTGEADYLAQKESSYMGGKLF